MDALMAVPIVVEPCMGESPMPTQVRLKMLYKTPCGYYLTGETAKHFLKKINNAQDLSYIDNAVRLTDTEDGFIAECKSLPESHLKHTLKYIPPVTVRI